MFDIGFWELTVIGVVALLVIGPERLPGVARTAGVWFGRVRRFVSSVKADIDQQLKAEELQKIMAEQKQSSGLHEIIEETRDAVESLNQPADYLVKSESNRADEAGAEQEPPAIKQQDNVDKS
ncbi:MAG: Sec-independent protein translocase protein TatB [Chromatiales bacterium]|nr:Sec-independent protein translocase protein TatB [Chromatiales bacterium]